MVHPRVQNIFAGIAAGALGGVCMLVFLALASLTEQDPWWRYPNLFGTTFYGWTALRSGLSVATISGAAFHVLTCGLVGAVFGWAFGKRYRGGRLMLLGIVVGLLWWYVSIPFYQMINPLIPLYSERVPTMLGDICFGACLGLVPLFLPRTAAMERLRRDVPAPDPETPPGAEENHETQSSSEHP